MPRVPRHSIEWAIPILVLSTLMLIYSPPLFSQGSAVDDETCLACHEGYNAGLAGTAHRLSSEISNPSAEIACVTCHSGGEVHIEDPSVDNISNPSNMEHADVEAMCSGCHQPHLGLGTTGMDPHIGQDMDCSTCHSVHGGREALLVDEEAGFCGECHVAITNEFRQTSNHPLTDQNVSCIDCHSFTVAGTADFGHGSNATCESCHSEQTGPFFFAHEATSSFSTEGHGCVSCHSPHGSPNDRLLNQPDDGMCQQCHGTPPLHTTTHGGIGTQYGCIECHSQVHGSFDSRFLLDQDLGTKINGEPGSCFCHNVSN